MNHSAQSLPPILFIPHGGGPLPLLGEPNHLPLIEFLRSLPSQFAKPDAIVLISAHWEERTVTISSGRQPGMIYDYFGFSPEAYQLRYPAAGQPELAARIQGHLAEAGINARLNGQRGFDHGTFVPLSLIYPDADIPVVQVSLLKSLDPAAHLQLGQALASLREQKVLIIGSGMSFHNLRTLGSLKGAEESQAFDRWLQETLTSKALSPAQRRERLESWSEAPFARACHPREEHLLPLHVCFGAALNQELHAERIFNTPLMGKTVSAYRWQ